MAKIEADLLTFGLFNRSQDTYHHVRHDIGGALPIFSPIIPDIPSLTISFVIGILIGWHQKEDD